MRSVFRDDALSGKVALVTGGGTGIGAAIARMLGQMGATVVIASRKASNIEPAAAGLSRQVGRPVQGMACDIRDRAAVDACVNNVVSAHGRVDILVNNGGGQFLSPAEVITPRGWDAVVATNLTGQWNMTQAVANAWMLANGGAIVNITMLTARGFPGMAHSVAARAGVEAMSRTLAVEWASRGVRINSVEPGLVNSSGFRRYPEGAFDLRELQRRVPMKRMASVEEIAGTVCFLVSPLGAYITGQTIVVDGGHSLWGDNWIIPDPEPLPEVVIPREEWEE
ncbi:MAG: SDR family oxidoreductase [Deltaproteobacteria bacterium]|nr:SDR family oxidoreductase [Deltaproteobacteria bacterium]